MKRLRHCSEIDSQTTGMTGCDRQCGNGAIGGKAAQDAGRSRRSYDAENRGRMPAFPVIVGAAADKLRPDFVARDVCGHHLLAA